MKTERGVENQHIFKRGDVVLFNGEECLFWEQNGDKGVLCFAEVDFQVPMTAVSFTGKVSRQVARMVTPVQ